MMNTKHKLLACSLAIISSSINTQASAANVLDEANASIQKGEQIIQHLQLNSRAFSAKMIEEAGLKGVRGSAGVPPRHSIKSRAETEGNIFNRGKALHFSTWAKNHSYHKCTNMGHKHHSINLIRSLEWQHEISNPI